MRSSIKIFEIFGISVNLHISFLMFILFLFILFTFYHGPIVGIIVIFFYGFVFFFLVVPHELSHSLVAIEFGYKVRSITLLPFGGAADVEMDENPRAEFLMALAGPLFNILLAWICLISLMVLTPNWEHYLNIFGRGISVDIFGFLGWLIWINFILAMYNLLPAFPMDGGRILRAYLALYTDYLKATKISSTIATVFFALMILFGLFLITTGKLVLLGMFLVLIPMFLLFAGESEVKWLEAKEKFRGMKNRDIAIQLYEIDGNSTIEDAINLSLFIYTSPYTSPPAFVVTMNGKAIGVIEIEEIRNKILNRRIAYNTPIYEVMNKEIAFVGADELVTNSFGKILSVDLCVVEDNGIIIGYILRSMIIRYIE